MMENDLKITLATARVNANMTQSYVAKQLCVGKQTICNWEKGRTYPGPAQILFLSNLYKIPLENIFLPKNIT